MKGFQYPGYLASGYRFAPNLASMKGLYRPQRCCRVSPVRGEFCRIVVENWQPGISFDNQHELFQDTIAINVIGHMELGDLGYRAAGHLRVVALIDIFLNFR